MTRIHFTLAVLIVTSALSTVAMQHKARKLFSELEHEQEQMRRLDLEWGQLQIEQRTWAAHAHIANIAKNKLHMQEPGAGQLQVIEAPSGFEKDPIPLAVRRRE